VSDAAVGTLLSSDTWTLVRDVAIVVAVVFWLATAYWVSKDARRRIAAPWLVGSATSLGLAVPFLGPIVYLFFRPPEYLEDIRERELEIRAIEQRLALRGLECPTCRAAVEPSYLVCPVCTTRLRQACPNCNAPVEAVWQACPYCAAHLPPAAALGDGFGTLRARRQSVSD
jgi:double zinc ribbon protein